MGMFDEIFCEAPLPGPIKPKTKSFQSKDLECLLDLYTITKDGRLLKDQHLCEYHGMLNFYTYEREGDYRYWFEYEAKFTDGILQHIELLKITINDEVMYGKDDSN